ncbi:MAG: hypothetical protein AAFT19_11645, partial [Pseudomonadota bacterium]
NMSTICKHPRILGEPDMATDRFPGRIVGRILDEALSLVEVTAQNALADIDDEFALGVCPVIDVNIPPHFETSFDGLVSNIRPDGAGRGAYYSGFN